MFLSWYDLVKLLILLLFAKRVDAHTPHADAFAVIYRKKTVGKKMRINRAKKEMI